MKEHDGVPVRAAATVILLRDAPELEALMLRRREDSLFASGAFVFPGGALDTSDHEVARLGSAAPGVGGRDDQNASRRLGVERGGLAYWMAAARECFEEAGLLLARTAEGAPADPATVEALGAYRPDVETGRLDFAGMVHGAGLVLDLADVHYFAHWITPVGPPRRYDTRFFVAPAPSAQEATPDGEETTEATWIRPADALAAHGDGDIDLIFPTLRSLDVLSRFDATDEVVVAARAFDADPSSHGIVRDHSGARIRLPGDPVGPVPANVGGDRA